MVSPHGAVAPPAPDGRLRLVLALVVAVSVVLAGLGALQVTVGGVPVVERLLPASGPELTVVKAGPPALDCGTAKADGGVVRGAGARSELGAAAQAERDASPLRDTLVAATGYERAGRVDVVWADGAGRARLVLTYAGSDGAWRLVGRSACAT